MNLTQFELRALVRIPMTSRRRVGARTTPEGLELWSYFFATCFDRDARDARLLLCDSTDLDVVQGIENTLRFVVSAAALAAGGFLLHAAGIGGAVLGPPAGVWGLP